MAKDLFADTSKTLIVSFVELGFFGAKDLLNN